MEGIEDPVIISAVGVNAPLVNNKCTLLYTNATSSTFQKRRMTPK